MRPPIRSRASRTRTRWPDLASVDAHVRPDVPETYSQYSQVEKMEKQLCAPAPTTMQSHWGRSGASEVGDMTRLVRDLPRAERRVEARRGTPARGWNAFSMEWAATQQRDERLEA
jgi:hypothetical protein